MVAFEDWYRAERRRVVASLVAISGQEARSRDCADEAFTRALEAWDRVGTMHSPTGWVYRVALNGLRRSLRRQAIEQRLLPLRPPPTVMTPSDPELWALVRQLPHRQRQAVVLRAVADMTEEQIASIMGITRGTVSSTLRDAYRRLEEALDPAPQKERQR